ncbi:MAG: pantoate--beta-alanine ligase [Alistipes sp.]|jgi:pantoate--beta-alanine ligase|nr:pantoate--beta-alanine ligase [Alistipes sp.]
MTVSTTNIELANALAGVTPESVMFVPTMGALHEGHLSLVRAARAAGGTVVVSIFVNPTQFNDPADLKNYPRTPERDLELLRAEGVDVVFMPTVEDIYPEGQGSQGSGARAYDFGELDKVMEGATRPGHFAGVAQVVSRLFELVRPARAFFGQKDFQQVAIVREMVRQARAEGANWAGVEIVECPTMREADGLARSSRNVLLSPEHRAAAPDIHRALQLGAQKAKELSRRELTEYVTSETERGGLLRVIYFDFMGPQACVAVQAGAVRLIDNMRYDN